MSPVGPFRRRGPRARHINIYISFKVTSERRWESIFFPFCFLFGDGKFKGQTRAKVRWPKKGVAEAFLLGGGGSLQWGLWPKKYRKNICWTSRQRLCYYILALGASLCGFSLWAFVTYDIVERNEISYRRLIGLAILIVLLFFVWNPQTFSWRSTLLPSAVMEFKKGQWTKVSRFIQ